MYAADNIHWTQYLSDVVDNYNSSYHNSIKTEPMTILIDHEDPPTANTTNNEIPIGSKVRIRNDKTKFTKSVQVLRWSPELYDVIERKGFRYRIKNKDGQEMQLKYIDRNLQVVHKVDSKLDKGAKVINAHAHLDEQARLKKFIALQRKSGLDVDPKTGEIILPKSLK